MYKIRVNQTPPKQLERFLRNRLSIDLRIDQKYQKYPHKSNTGSFETSTRYLYFIFKLIFEGAIFHTPKWQNNVLRVNK